MRAVNQYDKSRTCFCKTHVLQSVLLHVYVHVLWMCSQIYSFIRIHTAANEKDRRQMYNQEMKAMSETAKARMEGISGKASTFTRATHVEHVKGMFKVIMLFL